MGEVFNAILARRSIRKFQDKPVEQEKIDLLLQAAMAAPSACNLQPWAFVVVNDESVLAEVKAAAALGKYNAPLIIAVCGVNKHIPWSGNGWMQDCGAAVQNILLEAVELELGSVWVGGFNQTKMKEILQIPEDITVMCLIEIGYPAQKREPKTWYTDEAVHYNRFDAGKTRRYRTTKDLKQDNADIVEI